MNAIILHRNLWQNVKFITLLVGPTQMYARAMCIDVVDRL